MTQKQNQSLSMMAQTKLADLQARHLRRYLTPTQPAADGVHVTRNGVSLLSFCSNDYLGLAHDKRLSVAAQAALAANGTGAGASCLVSGDLSLNRSLETAIASYKGVADVRVFGSGYLANIGAIPTLVGRGDVIIMDELAHSCMHAGARLSGADIRLFAHNNPDDAATKLVDRDDFVHALILTETVFSMDGDAAPLSQLAALAEDHEAWLMSDDAHGLGLLTAENPAIVQMGTLSKSAGSYGGYVGGPSAFVDLLTSRARSFIYTTGLPAPILAASLAAISIMAEETWRGEKVHQLACHFAEACGLPKPAAAIVPMRVGDAQTALALSAHLQAHGFLVPAIRPPTVPAGTARLRFTFSAAHQRSDIEAVLAAIDRFDGAP